MAAKTITLYSPSGEKYETKSPSEATQLRMGSGYTDNPPAPKKPAKPAADGPSYKDLQAQAKEAGIPANQTKSQLIEALNAPAEKPADES